MTTEDAFAEQFAKWRLWVREVQKIGWQMPDPVLSQLALTGPPPDAESFAFCWVEPTSDRTKASGVVFTLVEQTILFVTFRDCEFRGRTAKGVEVALVSVSNLCAMHLIGNEVVYTGGPERRASDQIRLGFANGYVIKLPGSDQIYFDVTAAVSAIRTAARL